MSPITNSAPYILHDFHEVIQYDEQYNIHKSTHTWPCYNGNYESKFSDIHINIDEKLKRKEEVYELISTYDEYRQIYTDGSKVENKVACAFYIPHLKTGHGLSIPATASIYTAECYAVLIALKYIEEHPHASNKWLLISDSMSVLKALKARILDAKTSFIIYEIKSLWWKLKENNLEVKFLWTPLHIGVQGNESADHLAKSIVAADIVRITGVAIPHTDLYSILKQQLKEEWKMQWNAVLEAGKGRWYASINSELSIPWFSRTERYHSRKFYTIMCRLRFGHYRLNAHLSRMRIVASATCNFCDTEADQTAEHIIFNCPAYAIERLLLIGKLIHARCS